MSRSNQCRGDLVGAICDTVQKPPDRVFLIAHFSTWRSPRAMRVALSGSHRLVGSNGFPQHLLGKIPYNLREKYYGRKASDPSVEEMAPPAKDE